MSERINTNAIAYGLAQGLRTGIQHAQATHRRNASRQRLSGAMARLAAALDEEARLDEEERRRRW